MTDDKPPTNPKDEAGGDEADNTTPECEKKCWTDDYEKKISVESYRRYFLAYKGDGSEHSYSFPKKYKIIVPVKTGSKIMVEVRFKADPQSGVNATDAGAAKTKLENGVNSNWNNKFKLEVDDPDCGKKVFDIEYKVIWVTSGEDYTVKIHDTYPREGLTGFVMDVQKSTSDWIYSHEFAHTVGTPDEYSYTTDNETVKYKKPDGSLDSAVSAPPFKPSNAADATIMSSHSNTTVLKRHGWNIAIEVQELLRAKLGRQIKCEIIQP